MMQKKIIKKQLKYKSALFFNKSSLLKKTFHFLKESVSESKEKEIKAKEFSERNNDTVLEEYFIAWKERATMT